MLLGAAVIGIGVSGCTGGQQVMIDGEMVSAPSLASSPNNQMEPKKVDIAPTPSIITGGVVLMEPYPTSMMDQKYVVQKGDTLYGIAQKKWGAGKQWRALVVINPGLTAKNLKPGQILKVPSIPPSAN